MMNLCVIHCCGRAVIDHLDVLKKDNAGAREAIRWLETEFRKGNRLVQSATKHGIWYYCVCFEDAHTVLSLAMLYSVFYPSSFFRLRLFLSYFLLHFPSKICARFSFLRTSLVEVKL